MPRTRKTTSTLSTQLGVFFKTLGETANVAHSARASGIDRAVIYKYKRDGVPECGITPEEFIAAFEEAVELGNEFLEDTAVQRAAHGVVRDVYYQGEVVGEESVYSDGLLMFMLKARRPERFKDRSQSDVNAKLTGTVVVQTAGPTDEAL